MKIFISWSGDTSKDLALKLKPWLRSIIQQVDPFVSAIDILKGERWSVAVAERLEGTSEGIICVTRENQREPWLNFEAGALAKSSAGSSVRPVLLDLSPSEVVGPLANFQHTEASSREDMFAMLRSINSRCAEPIDDPLLEHTFNREWPEFDKLVNDLRARPPKAAEEPRESDDILVEILARVRAIERDRDLNLNAKDTSPTSQADNDRGTPKDLSELPRDPSEGEPPGYLTTEFVVGSQVEHPTYGLGTIREDDHYSYVVDFSDGSQHKVSAASVFRPGASLAEIEDWFDKYG